MSSASYRVRRATVDDLAQLMALWQSMQFEVDDLARRLTEFQVAEAGDGRVIGAIGLQMTQRHGHIHSEGVTDFALAEELRPLFWDRLHSLATNHGLLRLWTRERAPFWSRCGFAKADAASLEKMPPAWRQSSSGWWTLKLREDLEEVISADKEFALFMESEKQRSARLQQQARVLKYFAVLIALGVFILAIVGIYILLQKNPHLLHR